MNRGYDTQHLFLADTLKRVQWLCAEFAKIRLKSNQKSKRGDSDDDLDCK